MTGIIRGGEGGLLTYSPEKGGGAYLRGGGSIIEEERSSYAM